MSRRRHSTIESCRPRRSEREHRQILREHGTSSVFISMQQHQRMAPSQLGMMQQLACQMPSCHMNTIEYVLASYLCRRWVHPPWVPHPRRSGKLYPPPAAAPRACRRCAPRICPARVMFIVFIIRTYLLGLVSPVTWWRRRHWARRWGGRPALWPPDLNSVLTKIFLTLKYTTQTNSCVVFSLWTVGSVEINDPKSSDVP